MRSTWVVRNSSVIARRSTLSHRPPRDARRAKEFISWRSSWSIGQQLVMECMGCYAQQVGLPLVIVAYHLRGIDPRTQGWDAKHQGWLGICKEDSAGRTDTIKAYSITEGRPMTSHRAVPALK